MSVAQTYCRAEIGIDAPLVNVEANTTAGLPQVLIVGLPETAVRESKDRVKAAIQSAGFEFPSRRVTVNLAPADLPKTGGRYDLAIAMAILCAAGLLKDTDIADYCFLGELALNGDLRSVRGVLPATLQNRNSNMKLIVPAQNSNEAALAESNNISVARNLTDVIELVKGNRDDSPPVSSKKHSIRSRLRLADVKGQLMAKRALTIAAAGGHNMLMIGPPGTGKTMLASRLSALIPELSVDEALQVASIASVSRQPFDPNTWRNRPFRTPHHTSSAVAMAGGNSPPKPGEISLAHNGVLFLDELPEYSRQVLEVLREPLESGEVWISRAGYQVRYPADFQLISAMNPCPCGYYGDDRHECECPPHTIARYRTKVSGPLLDRIDIHIEVPALPQGTLSENQATNLAEEQHEEAMRNQICEVRDYAVKRQGNLNVKLSGRQIEEHCVLTRSDQKFLDTAVTKLGISTRGYFKILKLARTIADLSGTTKIANKHLTEALGYRRIV